MAAKKTAKKTPVKKVAEKKAPTPKVVVEKAPAKKVPVKKVAAKKEPAKKASAKKTVATKYTSEQIYSMIEQAAYYAAVNDGFQKDPASYWTKAEQEINSMIKG